MVLIIFLLIVWQYVTYITSFKAVYDLLDFLYYTLYDIKYHLKKASKYELPQSHTADQHMVL